MLPDEVKNPYELLGVRPTASDRDIRRAYRRRVVTTHRSRVLGLVEQLEELTRAYEALKDPVRRQAIDGASTRARAWSTSTEPLGESIGVRSQAAREVQRHSLRIGREAQRENAPLLTEVSSEMDRREAVERSAQRRQKRVQVATRLLWLVLLVAFAIFARGRFVW